MKTLLHVGCGYSSLQDLPGIFQNGQWDEVRYDINPDVQPDIVGTLQDMSLFEDGAIDAIYSSHNIEHIWAFEVPAVLSEFRRVLCGTGFALILCPDMMSVAQTITQGYLEKTVYESPAGPITALDIMYGFHKDLARGNLYMAHKTAFTAETLGAHLLAAGFVGAVIARDKVMGLHALAFPMRPTEEVASTHVQTLLPPSEYLHEIVRVGTLAA